MKHIDERISLPSAVNRDKIARPADTRIYQHMLCALNECRIGYRDTPGTGMNFLTYYYPFSEKEYFSMKRKGELLRNIFIKINSLYKSAMLNNDTYLLELVENGVLRQPALRKLHRETAVTRGHRLPLIFRGDAPDVEHFVEFHVGLRGLGILSALRKVMDEYYGARALFNYKSIRRAAEEFGSFLKRDSERVIFFKRTHITDEETFFLKLAFGENNELRTHLTKHRYFLLEESSGAKNGNPEYVCTSSKDFYHRAYSETASRWYAWTDKFFLNRWHNILRKYRERKIEIEPPPNLLYEQKILMALVWHPRYRDRFTEEERNVFPSTSIVEKNTQVKRNGTVLSLQSLIDTPQNKRTFVVKYAGLNPDINWGGKAVYGLRGQTKKYVERILSMALASYEKYREPWIIQKDISCKRDIRYYDAASHRIEEGRMYCLYRPYFMCYPAGLNTDMIDILVLFRKNFKVHATSQSVLGLGSFFR